MMLITFAHETGTIRLTSLVCELLQCPDELLEHYSHVMIRSVEHCQNSGIRFTKRRGTAEDPDDIDQNETGLVYAFKQPVEAVAQTQKADHSDE